MGCGLTSRYRVDRRRQRILTMASMYGGTVRAPTPKMWDVWTNGPGQQNWNDMMPLAVEILKDESEVDTPPPPTSTFRYRTPRGELMDDFNDLRRRIGPLFALPLSRRPRTTAPSTHVSGPRSTDDDRDLRVTVLVAMPFQSIPENYATEKEIIPDVALGTANIPWDGVTAQI
ncbi:hypothetical protein M422DRAFT_781994 [Sphaerobolus stellatus SS14]|uniref:Uncharacterized protein n=1 Tax=Sphaerobolus stellatus (strain SS14) TaxID=990650 RepID=A0A0C9VHB8_SPHS4|nr:hypothetical protein M422DRAFT_781994 [Sphaerobolus stellatus SS14]